jgi:hypothetical protein
MCAFAGVTGEERWRRNRTARSGARRRTVCYRYADVAFFQFFFRLLTNDWPDRNTYQHLHILFVRRCVLLSRHLLRRLNALKNQHSNHHRVNALAQRRARSAARTRLPRRRLSYIRIIEIDCFPSVDFVSFLLRIRILRNRIISNKRTIEPGSAMMTEALQVCFCLVRC